MFNAIGIKAIVCAPLIKHGRLVAMMAVHQSTPRNWTEEEVALVGEVVDRCWAHIERVRYAAMLEEQDRRKNEFLATLAHELRNPLAPIRYATAIMKTAQAGTSAFAHAQGIIERQLGFMSRLVDDFTQLPHTAARAQGGLGIGLALVKRLLQTACVRARPGSTII